MRGLCLSLLILGLMLVSACGVKGPPRPPKPKSPPQTSELKAVPGEGRLATPSGEKVYGECGTRLPWRVTRGILTVAGKRVDVISDYL